MSKNYIGYINANQTFTNDGIILNDANTVQTIDEDNLSNINTNFKYLYDLLTTDKRRINYLDIYRIDHSIGESEEEKIGQYFGQLPPGHSLSIALPFVEFNGVVYRKGDILLKEENGEALRIAAPAGGLFFPQIDVLKHQIKWIYTNNEQVDTQKHYNYIGEYTVYPLTDSSLAQKDNYYCYNILDSSTQTVVSSSYYLCTASASGQDPAVWVEILAGEDFTTFNYTTVIPTPSEPVRYNKQWDNVSANITISASDVIVKDSNPILPIVKYYHLNNSQYEEVYCDAYIDASTSDSGSTWVLTIRSIPSSYVDLVKAY